MVGYKLKHSLAAASPTAEKKSKEQTSTSKTPVSTPKAVKTPDEVYKRPKLLHDPSLNKEKKKKKPIGEPVMIVPAASVPEVVVATTSSSSLDPATASQADKKKKKRKRSKHAKEGGAAADSSLNDDSDNDDGGAAAAASAAGAKSSAKIENGDALIKRPPNALLVAYEQLVKEKDVRRAFDPSLPEDRRERVLDLFENGMDLVEKYGWAIPTEGALSVIASFAPIVEMAAGRGFWASLLRERGVDVIAYDVNVPPNNKGNWTRVLKGTPSVLANHSDRTLLLCYPDDFQENEASIASESLESFEGEHVIHVGEMFGTSLNADNAWGRSSGMEFQMRLVGEYHCILSLPLPSWPTSQDYLTVWKRSKITEVEEDGMIFVPQEEKISFCVAAPCCRQILAKAQKADKDAK